MAKVEMGILGGFSGRVGTVVGYYRRGGWYVRAYQPHIKDRRSEAQLAQRGRFKAMIQFASQATGVLRVGLREAARAAGLTEGNLFLKENHARFSRGTSLTSSTSCTSLTSSTSQTRDSGIDFAGLRFSKGRLAGLRLTEATVDEGGALRVKWQSLGGQAADRIHIFIYSEAQRQGVCAEAGRAAGHTAVLLPDGFAAAGLHVWAFAASASGRVSPTAYCAATEAAAGVTPADGSSSHTDTRDSAHTVLPPHPAGRPSTESCRPFP